MVRFALLSPSVLACALGCSGGEAIPGASSGDSATLLGNGDADYFVVYEPDQERSATDLAFNPEREGELWVVMRELDFRGAPCNEVRTDPVACRALVGTVAIVSDADTDMPSAEVTQDANAWHFMRRPTGIAFGRDDTFATCGEYRTGNFDDSPIDFMGPTLWSSDPNIFGPDGPGGNGSHLDMLHATPFGMGIAHERDNIYWVVNGNVGALDRYDFKQPHEPGGADHSDGEGSRWAIGAVTRVAGIPSHVVYDPDGPAVYVADTGGGRVIRFDVNAATRVGEVQTPDDQMRTMDEMDVAVEEVVPPGSLERPSGLALHDGVLLVTDNETSKIHAFERSGTRLATLDTGLPKGTLAGIEVGPDGRVYFVDLKTSAVRRIEPAPR